MTLGVGIIGAGVIGKRLSQAFDDVNDTKITGVCDILLERAKELAEPFGAHACTDYKELLRREDIHVIYVGVPPAYHHEIAIASLASGKHVLCEKPLALTPQECEEMVDAAATSGLATSVNLPFRYVPAAVRFKELVNNGYLGNLRRLELRFRFPMWPRSWQDVDWLRTRRQRSLREVGSHFYFAILEIFGKVKRVTAIVEYDNPEASEIGAVGILELESGTLCNLDLIIGVPEAEENSITAYGDKGTLSLQRWRALYGSHGDAEMSLITEEPGISTRDVVQEIARAAVSLSKGEDSTADLVSFDIAAATQAILHAILHSEGNWVSLQ